MQYEVRGLVEITIPLLLTEIPFHWRDCMVGDIMSLSVLFSTCVPAALLSINSELITGFHRSLLPAILEVGDAEEMLSLASF